MPNKIKVSPEIQENIAELPGQISQIEELNEEIIAIIPAGICVLDRKFRVCLWNTAMERMTHLPAPRIKGKVIPKIFPNPTQVQKICQRVWQEGAPFFSKSNHQFLINGSPIYCNLSVFPLKDRTGDISFILICLEDITECKSMTNKLEEENKKQARELAAWEKKFQALLEGSLEGIQISKGETVTYINSSLLNMLGYQAPHELIGRSLRLIYPPEDWEVFQKHIEIGQKAESAPQRFEIKAQKKDGTIIDLEVCTSHVYLNKEWVALASIRNITEKKEIEDREKKLNKHILHSDRLTALGRFSAGIAHEINNPLAVLSGRIQELLTKYKDTPELRRNFESMKKVSDRIAKIVDNLLFFSQKKKEPGYLHEINKVVEDAISMFEMQTVAKGVRLVKKYALDLPPIIVVASQIQQVCVNMLINAIDATKLGDVITISTKLDRNKENIIIAFKDTGDGIPREYMDKIFDPFFTTKEIGKGSGLGLSISSGIIKEHKGSIRVRSKENSWTVFTIKLPIPTPEDLQRYGLNPPNQP